MNGAPFRGLMRRDAICRVGPIRSTAYEGALEEFVWLAKLAREGCMRRVEGPLYFKRKHAEALSVKWDARGDAWKRAVWIEFGLGMLEAVWPVVPAGELEIAVSTVLERLCCPKDMRHLFYDPSAEAEAFATDLVTQARQRFSFTEEFAARIRIEVPPVCVIAPPVSLTTRLPDKVTLPNCRPFLLLIVTSEALRTVTSGPKILLPSFRLMI